MNSYLHIKNDYKKDLIKWFIVLIPLILYGIYKNGYLLYQKELIMFFEIFKPLYLTIISIVLSIIIEFIFTKKFNISYMTLNVAILSLFMMPNINYILYIVCLSVGLILSKILEKSIIFNQIAFLKLIIIFVCLIFSTYNYANKLEATSSFSFSVLDYFFGREVGGISATNVFMGIIIYLYLRFKTNYKSNIFLVSYLVYFILMFIYLFFQKNIDFQILLNANIILSFILIAPQNLYSPYKNTGIIVYSILLGIFTVFLTIILNPYEGPFLAIFILSIFVPFFDKMRHKVQKRSIF